MRNMRKMENSNKLPPGINIEIKNKNRPYRARLYYKGEAYHIGRYESLDEAMKEYNKFKENKIRELKSYEQ